MAIELISVQGLWPLVSRAPWLAAILARAYFTAARLAGMVYVDIYPRHEPVRVDLGAVASFQIHVQLMNLSPFELELDRANFQFWCGGIKLEATILKKERIAPGASKSLFLSGSIGDGQANQINRQYKNNSMSLDGNIEFNCIVRSFAKQVSQLSGIQAVVFNENQRSINS